jgi:hypothetical protein
MILAHLMNKKSHKPHLPHHYYPSIYYSHFILPPFHIIWLEKTNHWLRLEEPAFFVFEAFVRGLNKKTILIDFCKIFELSEPKAEKFISEMLTLLEYYSKAPIIKNNSFSEKESILSHSFIPQKKRNYYINKKSIQISYESELLEYYIHPPFAWLESKNNKKAEFLLDIFDLSGKHILRSVNTKEYWILNEIPELKRRAIIEIGNIIFNKQNSHWISVIHAAGISNGKEMVLLCSESGSGKSTLSLLLQNEGQSIASDDYIPIESGSLLAFPFPAATSVKKGSFELLSGLYPELKKKPLIDYKLTNKSLRFLPPAGGKDFNYTPLPVKAMIFVHYNPDKVCEFKALSPAEALPLFHEEAWVSPTMEHAGEFMDWFVGLEFYNLEYGDNERVLEVFKSIFFCPTPNPSPEREGNSPSH